MAVSAAAVTANWQRLPFLAEMGGLWFFLLLQH